MRKLHEIFLSNNSNIKSLILDFEKQKGKTIEEKWVDVREMNKERTKNLKSKRRVL